MKKGKLNLNILLRLLATISVVPLIFSTFFSGYIIKSADTPVEVSLFDYVAEKDFFLAMTFVCSVMLVLLIVAIIIISSLEVVKRKNYRFVVIMLTVFELILTITAFTFIAIYCAKNTISDAVVGAVTYTLGGASIIYFVCGILFGGLTLASYLIPEKKSTKKSNSENKNV